MSFINEYFTLNSKHLRSGYSWLLLSSSPPKTEYARSHRNYHVKYILDGSVTNIFEDGEITLKKGQGIIFPPHIPYTVFSPAGYRKLDLVVANKEPHTVVFQELLRLSNGEVTVTKPFDLNISYEELRYLLTVPSDFNNVLINNKSENMVLSVFENLGHTEISEFKQKIEAITAGGETKYDLKKLCELTGYSQTHFERLMVKHFGCSGIEYFNRIRTNNICTLLRTTSLSLPEIAEQTGFYDTSHLNAFFKKRTGTTPGKYRKE